MQPVKQQKHASQASRHDLGFIDMKQISEFLLVCLLFCMYLHFVALKFKGIKDQAILKTSLELPVLERAGRFGLGTMGQ